MAEFTDFFSYDPEKKKKDQQNVTTSSVDNTSGGNFTNFFTYDPEKQPKPKPSQVAATEQKNIEQKKKEETKPNFLQSATSAITSGISTAVKGVSDFLLGEQKPKTAEEKKIEQVMLDNSNHAMLSATNSLKKVQDESALFRDQAITDPNNPELKNKIQKNQLAQTVYGVYLNNHNDSKFDISFQNGVARSNEFQSIIEKTTSLQELITAVNAAQKYDLGMQLTPDESQAKHKYDTSLLLKLANKDAGFISGILMPSIDSEVAKDATPKEKLPTRESQGSATIKPGQEDTISQDFMANRQRLNEFAGSVLYPFGKPAYAPKSAEEVKTLQKQYDGSLFAKFNRVSGGATGAYVSGFTGGLLKPDTEAPQGLDEKIIYDISSTLGSAKAIRSIGGQFKSLAQGSTKVQEVIDKYPTVAKYAYPFIKNAVSFDIHGQLDPDIKNRFAKLSVDTITSIPFSGMGYIKSAKYAIPASFALGFGLAKLDGASDQDAFVSGSILGVLDAYGRLGGQGEQFIRGRTSDRLLRVEAVDVLNKYGKTKLTPESSADDFRSAYRKAAKNNHPDIGGDSQTFTQITNAYNYLNDKYGFSQFTTPQEKPAGTTTGTVTGTTGTTGENTIFPDTLPDLIQQEITKRKEAATQPEPSTYQGKEINLYRGSNKEVTETKKTFDKVLVVDTNQKELVKQLADGGDQKAKEILTNKDFFVNADKYLKEKYGTQYDAIQYNNNTPVTKAIGTEFQDLKSGEFFSVNKETASVYSRQNRGGKYQVATENLKEQVKKVSESAVKYNSEFQKNVEKVAKDLEYEFKHGPVKTTERMIQKVTNEYNGDVSQLRDANRSTILIDDPAKFNTVLDSVKKQFGEKSIDRVKEKFNDKYQSAIINIKTPDGGISEIQVTTPEFLKAKSEMGGHKLYEQVRVKEGDWEKAVEQMDKLYADARASMEARLKSSAEASVPSERALTGGKGLPEEVSPKTSLVEGSKSTLTKTPSTLKKTGNLESDINNTPSTKSVAQEQQSRQVLSLEKESKQLVETIKQALQSGEHDAAKDIYQSAKQLDIALPAFDSIKSEVMAQAEVAVQKEEQKITRKAKEETHAAKYGEYSKQVAKMKQFLAMNAERKNKKTGELYREHIPGRVAGVSSDEIATALGKTESEFLSELLSSIKGGLPVGRELRGNADFGGYATLESAKFGTKTIQAIEFPELLSMVKEINQNIIPGIKKMGGGKLGYLKAKEGVGGNIYLNPEIFEDEQLASKVFAHEIGHLVDFLPTKTLKRGNLLGRLATLRKYLSQSISEGGLSLKEERKRLKEKGLSKKEITKELKNIKNTSLVNKKVVTELKKLTQIWKPFDESADEKFTQYRYSTKELYADALSVLLNDPQLLKDTAPTFWKGFFDFLDRKPDVHRTLTETYSLLTSGSENVLLNRDKQINEMFKKGEDKYKILVEENKKKQKNIKFRLMYEWQNKNYGIVEKVQELQKKGKKIADDANPLYDLAELNYIGGEIKAWLESNVDPILNKLTENELSWEQDFSKLLFLERIAAGDRAPKANPLGLSPKTANEQMAFMKEKMTEEQWQTVTESANLFRSSIKQILDQGYEAGLYTDDTYKLMKENPAYATFQVIEYMEENIPATVYKQVGTLKEITDVASSTLIKTISTVRAAERNKAKNDTVSLLREFYNDDIKEAETRFNGVTKRQEVVEVDDQDHGTIIVMEKGIPKGYYVDPYIADIFKVTTPKTQGIALQWLKTLSNSAVKPAFTTFNLGFQTFNAVKDFMRYWKAMPDKNIYESVISLPKGLASYVKASPDAFSRAFGKPSNLIREMEGKKILGITYNDLTEGMTEEDTRIQRVMQKYLDRGIPDNKNPLIKYPVQLLHVIRKLGDFVETLPKVAAYNQLQGRLPDRELAQHIRTSVGSPDFLMGGNAKPFTNTVFMFSNAIIQGNYADYKTAFKNPRTRSGYWFKTIISSFLPKAIMFAALIGLLGEEWQKKFQDVSEYDRTNYTVVPLSRENNRTWYIRIPSDENGSFLGGLFWKTLRLSNRNKSAEDNTKDFLSYISGRLPGVSPIIQSIYATAQYMTGNNPYDFYRERNVIPDREFKAGGLYALQPFLTWQFQNVGGGVVWTNYVSEQSPETKTWSQKAVELPVVSNILGRWLKISNYGQKEVAGDIKKQMDRQQAVEQINESNLLNKAITEYYKGDQTVDRKREIAKNLVKDIVGKTSSNDPKENTKINNTIKKFKIGIEKKQGDPDVNSMIDAQTNDQKVELLKMYQKEKGKEEFKSFLKDLYNNKIISDNVIKDLKKAK